MNTKAKKNSLFIAAALLLVLLLAGFSLSACSKDSGPSPEPVTGEQKTLSYKIGTLQTDDLLPLWVAEKEGFLEDEGIECEIIVFQSAQEQIAAMVAGEIDGMMTDMVVPTQLTASGTPVKAVTVMQGAPAGVLVRPDSGIKSIAELKGRKVGNSSNTVLEFIMDELLAKEGLTKADTVHEEIKKLPVRFEMLTSGQIDAAVVPWTFFEIGKKAGMTPLADHEQTDNLTATILVFSEKFLSQEGADTTITKTLNAWNQAVDVINKEPAAQLELLAEKTKLPEQLAKVYPVREYPYTAAPSTELFGAVVNWMHERGYIAEKPALEDLIY